MKIKIDELTENGLELNFSGQEDILSRALESIPESPGLGLDPRITGHVSFTVDGENIFLIGSVKGLLHLQCSRCLADFDLERELDLSLVLRRELATPPEEHEIMKAEGDEIQISGMEIDLGKIIAQELLLSVPMKPLCNEDCPGLCPDCGSPKGSDGCICSEQDRTDPRWEALAKLKDKIVV
ncbi:MAG: DUF177 domain-containing protein [Desulfomonile tiedjei]|uniref:DUF177 domain-containing protein n=1 Tax=Desulfomonile tiedjei TaxID=2358 RepID=A0A9D6V6Z7_9BACT|nr:DUF177 domain-containing protein [Desulfomonile tiedjei]